MTDIQRRGQAILTASIIVAFTIAAVVVPLYFFLREQGGVIQPWRLGLAIGLLAWLYQGSKVAKGICMVLFGTSGLYASYLLFHGGALLQIAVPGLIAIGNLSFTAILIASPSVSAFLKYKRSGLEPKRKLVPVGEAFSLPKLTALKALDRLTLAIPAAVVEPGESVTAVVCGASAADITALAGDDKIYIRISEGTQVWLKKSVHAIVLPWAKDETRAKRIVFSKLSEAAA